MSNNYLFQQIRRGAKSFRNAAGQPLNFERNREEARDWFKQAAMRVSSASAPNIFDNADPFTKFAIPISERHIGKMFMFQYDAKHKKTLPYYDRFPIIFPIERYNDGFLGINLHYLSPVQRSFIMDELYTLTNNGKSDKTTKLIDHARFFEVRANGMSSREAVDEARISYQFLKATLSSDLFKPMIHRYLYQHMVTPNLYYINPGLWDYAVLLPTERFVQGVNEYSVNSQHVWSDANRR